jgi:hypothetical protein
MAERSKTRITVSFALAVAMIVGFAFAPAVVAADDDTPVDDAGGDVVDIDTDGLDTDTSDSSDSTGGVSVNIVDTNSPVQTGDTLVVTVDARTEEGGIAELLIDGESVDSQGFAPGQDGRVNFTWETSYPDAGEHNATVRSGTDSDRRTVEVEPGADAPDGTCRDVPKEANGEVPYEDLPSRDDLPEEAPGTPIPPFVTPEAIAGIIVGAAPNQCDIQDPNDPSVDPNDPPSEPSVSVIVYRSGQYKDGAVLLVYYEATLNRSGDGPGVSGFAGGIAHSDDAGTNPSVNVNDGEKNYAVDPRYRADDSTSDGSVEVSAPFGTVGANLDCSSGECRVTPQGVIEPPENPAIPAPIWDGED